MVTRMNNVSSALTRRFSSLAWWQGMLVLWIAAHAAAIALFIGLLALTVPAQAAPPACTSAPCELKSYYGGEFEWLGWYARNQQHGFVVDSFESPHVTKAAFHGSRQSGLCGGMCTAVAGIALNSGIARINPDAVFCFCGSMPAISSDRWSIWSSIMPTRWVEAMRTRRPFHWPLRDGEGI
jgi:hypothetical protein